jgi:hypothetical protein
MLRGFLVMICGVRGHDVNLRARVKTRAARASNGEPQRFGDYAVSRGAAPSIRPRPRRSESRGAPAGAAQALAKLMKSFVDEVAFSEWFRAGRVATTPVPDGVDPDEHGRATDPRSLPQIRGRLSSSRAETPQRGARGFAPVAVPSRPAGGSGDRARRGRGRLRGRSLYGLSAIFAPRNPDQPWETQTGFLGTASTDSTPRSSDPNPRAMSSSMRRARAGSTASSRRPAASSIRRASLRAIVSSNVAV